MNVSRVGRASLRVRDLEASARFYSKVLHLPVLTRGESAEAIELGVGKSDYFALRPLDGPDRGNAHLGLNHIAFVIGNNSRALQEAAAHLSAHGIAYERVEHDDYESLLLHDPDGHLIELYYWPEW